MNTHRHAHTHTHTRSRAHTHTQLFRPHYGLIAAGCQATCLLVVVLLQHVLQRAIQTTLAQRLDQHVQPLLALRVASLQQRDLQRNKDIESIRSEFGAQIELDPRFPAIRCNSNLACGLSNLQLETPIPWL